MKNFWLMALGAAIAYLFDPISGRGRRAELMARSRSQASDMAEKASARARYEAGRAKGVVYETVMPEQPPDSDRELLQKIRSEAVGHVDGSLGHVDIRVDRGVVHLVGPSVDHAAEQQLVERIRDVTGVQEVHNELVPA